MVVVFHSRMPGLKERFNKSFYTPSPSPFLLLFLIGDQLRLSHHFHSLGQDQPTVAEQADCRREFPNELYKLYIKYSFHIGSNAMPG